MAENLDRQRAPNRERSIAEETTPASRLPDGRYDRICGQSGSPPRKDSISGFLDALSPLARRRGLLPNQLQSTGRRQSRRNHVSFSWKGVSIPTRIGPVPRSCFRRIKPHVPSPDALPGITSGCAFRPSPFSLNFGLTLFACSCCQNLRYTSGGCPSSRYC